VGRRAGLDGCGKSRRHRDSIPGTKEVSQYIRYNNVVPMQAKKSHGGVEV